MAAEHEKSLIAPGRSSHLKGSFPCVDCPAFSWALPWWLGPWPRITPPPAPPSRTSSCPPNPTPSSWSTSNRSSAATSSRSTRPEQLKQVLDGQDAKKLLTEIGLDPLKDIDRVVVGANVKGRTDTKFLMIVHGDFFDPDRLYTAAERQSKVDADRFAMIKDGDAVVFKYTPENGENLIYGTVVNDKTVIAASDRKMIANALKAAEAGKKAPIKTDSPIWSSAWTRRPRSSPAASSREAGRA